MKIKNTLKRSWEAIILIAMTGYDASLHWVEVLSVWKNYFLYPNFPLFDLISYNFFWTCYWTFAFLLTIKLLIKINRRKNFDECMKMVENG